MIWWQPFVLTMQLMAGSVLAEGYPFPVVVERPVGLAIEVPALDTVSLEPVDARAAAPAPVVAQTEEMAADDPSLPTSVTVATADVASPALARGGQAAAGPFEADSSISLRVSDDVATLTYERDARRLGIDNGRVQAGFLLSEQRDTIFTGTLMVDTRPDLVPQVRLSVGARAYAALLGVENRDVVALGLGVEGFYSLPIRVLPLELQVGAFYAPDVLAFGQADRIIEWNADVGLRLRERLAAYAGFHFLQVDTRPGDREIDDEIHIGIRWTLDSSGEDAS